MPAAEARSDRARDRLAFFERSFPDFWYDVGTARGHPYALFDVARISAADVRALRRAARDAWQLFVKTAEVLRRLPDADLARMGIPEVAMATVRARHEVHPALFARFDFALTAAGPRVLELNSTTPFLLWESHEIAGAVARRRGFRDPNAGAREVLRAALAEALRATGPRERIAVTAMNPWREDWMTARFLAAEIRTCGRAVDEIPTHELRMRGGRLADAAGPIDTLVSMYPLEHFARDRDGASLCEALERGRLRLLNPPEALLLQSKAAQAVLWGLAEAGAFFDERERERIAGLFLPSSMDSANVRGPRVEKPVLGREGGSVRIVGESGVVSHGASAAPYDAQPFLSQSYVELPRVTFEDPRFGAVTARAVHTVFVAGGEPAGLCCRVGGVVTDAWAQMLPLGLD